MTCYLSLIAPFPSTQVPQARLSFQRQLTSLQREKCSVSNLPLPTLTLRSPKEFIARREQKRLLELFGKLDWDSAYDYKAERDRR